MATNDNSFRFYFTAGPVFLDPFLDSLRTLGLVEQKTIRLSGWIKPLSDNDEARHADVLLAIQSLAASDTTGYKWIFTGKLEDDRFVTGSISLRDGKGELRDGKQFHTFVFDLEKNPELRHGVKVDTIVTLIGEADNKSVGDKLTVRLAEVQPFTVDFGALHSLGLTAVTEDGRILKGKINLYERKGVLSDLPL